MKVLKNEQVALLVLLIYACCINADDPSGNVIGSEYDGWDVGGIGKVRLSREALPLLPSIHNKLLNVARFANGLAVAETLANGNITFGRIATILMVADQFEPGSDWIHRLAEASSPDMDRIVSQLGSFESFLEGSLQFDIADEIVDSVVESISYGNDIILVQRQVEAWQKTFSSFESMENSLKPVEDLILGTKLDTSIEAVSVLQLLPEALHSFFKLRNSSTDINSMNIGLGVFYPIAKNDSFLALLENFSNTSSLYLKGVQGRNGAVEAARNLREAIKNATASVSLDSLQGKYIY